MVRVLELFSGTGSVGKCCDQLGWEKISVDLLLPADHECDIMDFDYKQYPKDHFDIVWASPPCTFYSNLQNCWIGRKRKDGVVVSKEWIEEKRKESDILIKKSFEIIEYFNPEYWFLENPFKAQLKDRDIMKGIPYYDCSYCMYSDWGYEKKTRIWTNKKDWNNLICDKSGSCGNMEDSQHKKVLGNGYELIEGKKIICNTKDLRLKHKKNVSKEVHSVGEKKGKHKKDISINFGSGTDRLDRYRIPEDLIYSLFLE